MSPADSGIAMLLSVWSIRGLLVRGLCANGRQTRINRRIDVQQVRARLSDLADAAHLPLTGTHRSSSKKFSSNVACNELPVWPLVRTRNGQSQQPRHQRDRSMHTEGAQKSQTGNSGVRGVGLGQGRRYPLDRNPGDCDAQNAAMSLGLPQRTLVLT